MKGQTGPFKEPTRLQRDLPPDRVPSCVSFRAERVNTCSVFTVADDPQWRGVKWRGGGELVEEGEDGGGGVGSPSLNPSTL